MILPPPVPITANPTTFQITTHAVNTVHTVGITASGESGASGTNNAFATIRVHPPAPTSVSVTGANGVLTQSAITLVGGKTANGPCAERRRVVRRQRACHSDEQRSDDGRGAVVGAGVQQRRTVLRDDAGRAVDADGDHHGDIGWQDRYGNADRPAADHRR